MYNSRQSRIAPTAVANRIFVRGNEEKLGYTTTKPEGEDDEESDESMYSESDDDATQ